MPRSDMKIQDLVGMIERGELCLPEMQRRYVWRSTRVRDLLDSLYRGYPSGSILIWETDKEHPTRDIAVSQQQNPFAGHKLLLDGQQRLTSLSAVLRGEPIKVRGRRRPIDILFNLDHPDVFSDFTEVEDDQDSPLTTDIDEEINENGEVDDESEINIQERMKKMTFVVGSRALSQKSNWVSVSEVFKSDDSANILRNAGVTSLDDPKYFKYSQRIQKLRAIKEYSYNVNILPRDLRYEEVAEIFVRVNSLGVKLRGSDLALAQITARWNNSLKLLEEFQEECEEKWMTLDVGLLVRAMVVFTTKQSRFDKVANTPIEELKKGWEKAKDGLRFAINFLSTNAGIEDESLLSSPLFFIVIAYFSYVKDETLTDNDQKKLLYWLYIANARGRYSRGSTESLLDADLSIIHKSKSVDGLLDLLKQQFGRLDIELNDFIGRGAGSPLFSLVFLALKANGAKDWYTGLGLSLTHQGRYHYIQYHHIFPKSLLKGTYDKKQINEIANMAFISGRTNRRISNKQPVDYLPSIVSSHGEDVLTKQGIPLDKELHKIDNFEKFLDMRRQSLLKIVDQFINQVKLA